MLFNSSYFIGHQIKEIDKRILQIRLPKSIRRNLKPLSDREHYHSHEWKYLLIFVAYPILKNILPERYNLAKCSIVVVLIYFSLRI